MKLTALIPLVLMAATPAWAEDYPTHTVTLICPQSPGGTNDTLGRVFATAMSNLLGQQIIVENRDGGGGVIGAQLVAESEPDGYTLLIGSNSTHTVAPATKPNLAYDPIADFQPIFNFANVPFALVVHPDLGVKNMKELVALANERPGELNYASGGIGTSSHFAIAMFVSYAGIADKTVHIPYNGGGQAAVGISSGEVQFWVGPMSASMTAVIDSGRVIPLAVSGPERLDSLPDIPTFAEAGMPEYTAVGWFGIMAPANTPPKVVAKISDAANKATELPEVIAALASNGVKPYKNTPEEFSAMVRKDFDDYRDLITKGIVQIQ